MAIDYSLSVQTHDLVDTVKTVLMGIHHEIDDTVMAGENGVIRIEGKYFDITAFPYRERKPVFRDVTLTHSIVFRFPSDWKLYEKSLNALKNCILQYLLKDHAPFVLLYNGEKGIAASVGDEMIFSPTRWSEQELETLQLPYTFKHFDI